MLALLTQYSLLHAQDSQNSEASFATKIEIKEATKDGIYLNGYVVNIPYHKLYKLNGKTVRISGKVSIIQGLKHKNNGAVRQGREENTKHILKPRIKVIDN
jgi:hypothetical protein